MRVSTLVCLAGFSASCSSAPLPQRADVGLSDPRVVRRMEALREVDRSRETEYVPALIELLDDEDPGVRLMAGAILTDLTGHRTGYRADAGPAERREHVLRWREWWAARTGGGPPAECSPRGPSAVPSPGVPPSTTPPLPPTSNPAHASPPPPPPPPPLPRTGTNP